MNSNSSSTSSSKDASPWSEHAPQITTPQDKYLDNISAPTDERLRHVGPPPTRSHHSSSIVPSPSGDIYIFGGWGGRLMNDTWAIRISGDSDLPLGPGRNNGHMGVTSSLVETTGETPSPRFGHQSVLANGLLVVWGGSTSTVDGKAGPADDNCVYALNITTCHWTKLDIQPAPSARGWYSACVCGNKFIAFGGRLKMGEHLNDLWGFDLDSVMHDAPKWERIAIAPGSESPSKRRSHTMVAYREKLYVFGGWCNNTRYNDTWCFDMATRVWAELKCTGPIPPPRDHHAATLVGDAMYIFGGVSEGEKDLGDTWSFKIHEQRWYRFPSTDAEPSARFGHILATINGCVLLVGGVWGNHHKPGYFERIHILDADRIDYLEKGEEITLKSTSRTKQLHTITGAMSATEILHYLVLHGCHDVSKELDISHVSEYPVSSGGFGDVYCATLHNGHRVGLKCTRILVDPTTEGRKFLKRAAHELYVWSKCKHPNILELSGVTLFRDQVAMVSPWIEHGHLRWYLHQHPQADRCVLCAYIASGVSYLHQNGTVHGDLKPENILVAQDNIPKLTDFGNAALSEYTLQFSHSMTTQSMSMRWTAPEIISEETKTTQAGDVYALGMIIFEAITGILPYDGVKEPAIMRRILTGNVPSRPEAHIPSGIEEADRLWVLITSCWASDPKERPKAEEVKNVIEGITPAGLLANRS